MQQCVCDNASNANTHAGDDVLLATQGVDLLLVPSCDLKRLGTMLCLRSSMVTLAVISS